MDVETHLTHTCVRRADCTIVLVLAIVLASCGWESQHEVAHDVATSPSGVQSPAKQHAASQTYFGAEYEVQQSALRDAPLEPAVQAF